MANEIKTKITLEGEKAYKQALSEINRQLRESQSAVRAAAAEYQAADGATRTTAEQTDALTQMLERQREKLALMQAQLTHVEEQYGANSREAVLLRTNINATRAEMAKTQTQLRGLADSLEASADASESLSGGMADTAGGLDKIGKSAGGATQDVHGLAGEIGSVIGQKVIEFSIGQKALDALKAGLSAAIGEAVDSQMEHSWMLANAGNAELAAAREGVQANLDKRWAGRMDGMATAAAVTSVDTAYGNMSLTDAERLTELTSRMIGMQEAGWGSVSDMVNRSKTMVNAFGITAEEALDLMARGYQDSADGGSLLNTSLERGSQLFQKLGYDADDTVAALVSATQNEELGRDGNLVKGAENLIDTLTSGSDEAKQALQALGIEATDLPAKFEQGGETAAAAVQLILQNLMAIDDTATRDALGKSLFGDGVWTQTGGDIARALLAGYDQTIRAEGAASDAAAALVDNVSDAIAGSNERIAQSAGEAFAGVVDAAKEAAQSFNAAYDEGGLIEGIESANSQWQQSLWEQWAPLRQSFLENAQQMAQDAKDGVSGAIEAIGGLLGEQSQQISDQFYQGAQEPDESSAQQTAQRWVDVLSGRVQAAAQEDTDDAAGKAMLESTLPAETILTERMAEYAKSHKDAVVAQMTEVYGQDAGDEDFQAWQAFQAAMIDSAYDETVESTGQLGADAADAETGAILDRWESARGAGVEFGHATTDGAQEGLDGMGAAGENAASSTVDGLRSGIDGAYQAGYDTGKAYQRGYNAALEIHSPSRVMRMAADDTLSGLMDEYDAREQEIYARGAAIAEAFAGGYSARGTAQAQTEAAPAVDAQAIASAVRDALEDMGLYMDGERVGRLTARGVSREIAAGSARTASGRGAQVRSW